MEAPAGAHDLEEALKAFEASYRTGSLVDDAPMMRLLLALVAENRRLDAELKTLARSHARLVARLNAQDTQKLPQQAVSTPARLPKAPAPAPPRIERPLSYWAANVPAYGEAEALGPAEAARYLSRPRIDPGQITLTEEDLARLPSPRKRYLQTHLAPHLLHYTLVLLLIVLATCAAAWMVTVSRL